MVLVEQKMTIALRLSNRCLIMGHGRIVFSGTPEELQRSPAVSPGMAGGGLRCVR